MVIVMRGYNLYTGKVGYVNKINQIPKILLIILGNLIGTFLISLCTNVSTTELILTKTAVPLYLTFGKAIGCGFLMYIAVDIYKISNSLLGVFGCVPAFILSGFEHSIADMFYVFSGNVYNLRVLIFILVVTVGNALGAFLHKLIS